MNLKRTTAAFALLAGLGVALQACAEEEEAPVMASGAPHLAADSVLTRIAFGSCANEEQPQPIWSTIAAAEPDLFLFIGDNIYVDRQGRQLIENPGPETFTTAYARLGANADFSDFRGRVPIMAGWDDHDYGKNDGGAEWEHKQIAKDSMLDFFGIPDDAPVRRREGVYHAASFGPSGKRVQIIILDTRWSRSALKRKGESAPRGNGPYVPQDSADQAMLGEAQWAWLEAELKKPADLRLLVSSIQVLADGHDWERWGQLPAERERLYALLAENRVAHTVILSGDRHVGGFYRIEGKTAYPLYEVTSSSLNVSFAKDNTVPEIGPHQLGHLYGPENFGLITVDWGNEVLSLELKSGEGQTVRGLTMSLEDLEVPE